jgi:hypothetical protein
MTTTHRGSKIMIPLCFNTAGSPTHPFLNQMGIWFVWDTIASGVQRDKDGNKMVDQSGRQSSPAAMSEIIKMLETAREAAYVNNNEELKKILALDPTDLAIAHSKRIAELATLHPGTNFESWHYTLSKMVRTPLKFVQTENLASLKAFWAKKFKC